MTEKKYTPGPWGIVNGKKLGSCSNIDGKGFKNLCKVRCWIKGTGRADIEGFANAQLIAAAPDLLECLEDLLSQVIGQGHDFEHSSFYPEIQAAKEAIQKAYGQKK